MIRVPFIVWFVLTAFFASYTAKIWWQPRSATAEKHTITVRGTGEVTAQPDIAYLTLGLVSEAKTASDVQNQSSQKMIQVHDFVTAQGIITEDMQTTNYDLQPTFVYADNKPPVLTGFRINQSLQIKVRKLDKLGDIIAGAVNAGANQVSGPVFSIDDDKSLESEARTQAFADAKRVAGELCAAAGVGLGDLVTFQEDGVGRPLLARSMLMDGVAGDLAKSAAPPIAQGQQKISVSVSVTYEIR